MTLNDSLARKIYRYQNNLQSFYVKVGGTSISTILIEIEEDKYGNQQQTIRQFFNVDCMFNFPQDEIPTSLSSTHNNMSENSSQVLHMWELLPISLWVKNEDIKDLKFAKGSIILYPIKKADDDMQVMEFQIVDLISKGNPSSGILYSEYIIAPATDFALRETEEYKKIIEDFKESSRW